MSEQATLEREMLSAMLEWQRLLQHPDHSNTVTLLKIAISHAISRATQQPDPPASEPHQAEAMNGIAMIAAERARQIAIKGWIAQHDMGHTDGSLAATASTYTRIAASQSLHGIDAADGLNPLDWGWPRSWDFRWFKPRSRVENLVRAGALIVAELDRLAEAKPASDLADRYCEIMLDNLHNYTPPPALSAEETARKGVVEQLQAHVYRLNDAGLMQFRDDANAILAAINDFARPLQEENAKLSEQQDLAWESAKMAAEAQVKLCKETLRKIEFIASAAGHAPCRSGGIDAEGVCPNTCTCEWAAEIATLLAALQPESATEALQNANETRIDPGQSSDTQR